jgi:hypothetical protein
VIDKTFFRVCNIFFLSLFLSACVLPSSSQQTTPRTYYESLDLSTPESSVITFTDAFQRYDFPTVYWIFSPKAQDQLMISLNLFQYNRLVKVDESFNPTETNVLNMGFSDREHIDETSYIFDRLMMEAKEYSAFLVDLSRRVAIMDTIQSSDDHHVDVITSVEGIDGNVVFRTIKMPSGRWRVLQVIVPDGDENQIPWSVPVNPVQ